LLQPATILSAASAAGTNNIKVASVADFRTGQTILLDTGANREAAVIASVGTSGGTTVRSAASFGTTAIPVASAAGFNTGQTITIDTGANQETAVVASVAGGGRGGGNAMITVTAPLKSSHAAGVPVSGTGITLAAVLTKDHASGAQINNNVSTPGGPNKYEKISR
jgi:hypothetical protein